MSVVYALYEMMVCEWCGGSAGAVHVGTVWGQCGDGVVTVWGRCGDDAGTVWVWCGDCGDGVVTMCVHVCRSQKSIQKRPLQKRCGFAKNFML